jgi:hypothetical protein
MRHIRRTLNNTPSNYTDRWAHRCAIWWADDVTGRHIASATFVVSAMQNPSLRLDEWVEPKALKRRDGEGIGCWRPPKAFVIVVSYYGRPLDRRSLRLWTYVISWHESKVRPLLYDWGRVQPPPNSALKRTKNKSNLHISYPIFYN